MIILYDEKETNFTTLGNGVLKDAITCVVTEELNGKFILEMEYPVSGAHFKDISLRKIIFAKPNKYDDYQAFRIRDISAPINGVVTVNAEHLSYDLSGYIVEPFDEPAKGILNAFAKINEKIIGTFPFTFTTDIENTESSFGNQTPATVRSILAGVEGSLLDTFHGEYVFNNYVISLRKNRGLDRGFKIRYGKNMTDVTREIKSDKLYTDVYPFYYKIVTESETTTTNVYQNLYIRTAAAGEEPIEPFSKDWLSLKPDNMPFTPLIKNTPIKIATEGEYFGKIYIWTDVIVNDEKVTKYVEVSESDYPPNIPSSETTSKEVTEIVVLDEKTIPIEGRESISPKRYMSLDLTNSFADKPSQEDLKKKAEEYIKNNNVGEIVESVEASFIKIDDPSINEVQCMLGDHVGVIFKDISLSANLQVISTEYDVIGEKYIEIGLGKKQSNMSDNVASIGDNVSMFENDCNYTDELKVSEIIAKTVTAEYIESTQAKFSQAQIVELQTNKLIAEGLIQAAEIAVDELVAEMMVSDNAAIRKQLTVGENLIINGEINIDSGSIAITNDTIKLNNVVVEPVKAYINKDAVSDYGLDWLKEYYDDKQSMQPDPTKVYKVYDIHGIWTRDYYKWDTSSSTYTMIIPETSTAFEVDSEGNLFANSADIKGKITATSGDIGGCIINGVPDTYTEAYVVPGQEKYSSTWLSDTQGGSPLTPVLNSYYRVYENYEYIYYIWNGTSYEDIKVGVLQVDGALIHGTLKSVTIESSEIKIGSDYYPIDITADNYIANTYYYKSGNTYILDTSSTYTSGRQYYEILSNFHVDDSGDVTIRKGNIYMSEGSIELGQKVDESGQLINEYNFELDNQGIIRELNAENFNVGGAKLEYENNVNLISGTTNLYSRYDDIYGDGNGNMYISSDVISTFSNTRVYIGKVTITAIHFLLNRVYLKNGSVVYSVEFTVYPNQVFDLSYGHVYIKDCLITDAAIRDLLLNMTHYEGYRTWITPERVTAEYYNPLESNKKILFTNNDFIYQNGYIDSRATEYGSDWLRTSNDSGSVSIIPKAGIVYKVYDSTGKFTNKYYSWNSTNNRYEEFDPNFSTDLVDICARNLGTDDQPIEKTYSKEVHSEKSYPETIYINHRMYGNPTNIYTDNILNYGAPTLDHTKRYVTLSGIITVPANTRDEHPSVASLYLSDFSGTEYVYNFSCRVVSIVATPCLGDGDASSDGNYYTINNQWRDHNWFTGWKKIGDTSIYVYFYNLMKWEIQLYYNITLEITDNR